jgi:hypothetical protein
MFRASVWQGIDMTPMLRVPKLQTTGQVLRENHLTLRLYAKRSPLQNAEFFGECWLPFMRIYDANALQENNPTMSHSLFYEKLWFEGKCVGYVEGIILVHHNLLVRQRSTGVSTDDGIIRVSSSIIRMFLRRTQKQPKSYFVILVTQKLYQKTNC